MLDYHSRERRQHICSTPPCLPIFTIMETMKWLKEIGGLKVMEKMNIEKPTFLYNAIDSSKMFVGTAEKDSRSLN